MIGCLQVFHLLLSILACDVNLFSPPLAAWLEQIGTISFVGCDMQ